MARLAWLEMQKLSSEEQETVAELLAQVPLLKTCSPEERLKLAKYTTKHSYSENELILTQGDGADGRHWSLVLAACCLLPVILPPLTPQVAGGQVCISWPPASRGSRLPVASSTQSTNEGTSSGSLR